MFVSSPAFLFLLLERDGLSLSFLSEAFAEAVRPVNPAELYHAVS